MRSGRGVDLYMSYLAIAAWIFDLIDFIYWRFGDFPSCVWNFRVRRTSRTVSTDAL